MAHIVDLHAYGVTAERGFLPIDDPNAAIPLANAEWHQTARDLPALIPSGHIRAIIEALPEFRTELLQGEEDLEAAMRTLSYLGQAYVWGEPEAPTALPARLAVPWHTVASALGREPILSYASYALWNWRRLEESGPIALGNIALLQHFLGGIDEAWFILIHVDIERRAGAALAAGAAVQAAISTGDGAAATAALTSLGDALEGILATMQRMPEHCDPYVYYHRVRPYIFGWHNNPALPGGLVYEGVTAYAGAGQTFRGETGAQSTIVPCLDAILGVEHAPDQLRTYLMEMRRYMPRKHVGLLEAFEAGPTALSHIQTLGSAAPEPLVAARARAVDLLRAFRALHLEYAATYINRQAADATGNPTDVGTGGTPFMKYLKKHRDETEAAIKGA
jgi:indoleamine 2,3-dioxygenase